MYASDTDTFYCPLLIHTHTHISMHAYKHSCIRKCGDICMAFGPSVWSPSKKAKTKVKSVNDTTFLPACRYPVCMIFTFFFPSISSLDFTIHFLPICCNALCKAHSLRNCCTLDVVWLGQLEVFKTSRLSSRLGTDKVHPPVGSCCRCQLKEPVE